MKIYILLIFAASLLTSCYSYKSISAGKELTTEDIRQRMHPTKIHRIILKSGATLKVSIVSVDSTTVYGKVLERDGKMVNTILNDTPENLRKNVVAIYRRKFNIYQTIGIVAAANILFILIIEDMMEHML
jgi:PBP1b-binding outer membrane lipoprotein LpoB